MTPLFAPRTCCSHPAIKAAKLCRKAMELANANHPEYAEWLLRNALGGLRQQDLPMMKAKLLNSLGLVFAQQNNQARARRCMALSLRIVADHVGTKNWLYARIKGNHDSLSA